MHGQKLAAACTLTMHINNKRSLQNALNISYLDNLATSLIITLTFRIWGAVPGFSIHYFVNGYLFGQSIPNSGVLSLSIMTNIMSKYKTPW